MSEGLRQSWPLLLLSVCLGVAGQLALKVGMNRVGVVEAVNLARPLAMISRLAPVPLVWVGLACYGLSALLWMVILSRMELSAAYLMLASMYVLIPLVSWLVLGERIPPMRWVGMAVVVLGVLIVARS
jgi:multidrug transporter EmrE-like cation transporter